MSTSIIALPTPVSASLEELESYLKRNELCQNEQVQQIFRSVKENSHFNTPEEQYFSLKKLILAFGKCSLSNGEMFSFEFESLRAKLFQASRPLLKNLWMLMGREHHSNDEFDIYEKGSIVRMLIGKTRVIDMYDKYIPVPHQNWILCRDWTIVSNSQTDISNMPEYIISNRHGQIVCRHTALRLE